MKLELTSEHLKTVCEPFDFTNPPYNSSELAHALTDLMMEKNGVGLAANQCGIPLRVFAIRTDPFFVMFNPKIVDLSEEYVILDEGCLSFPGMMLPIKRPLGLRVRFQGPDGNTYTEKFNGMTSRIIQHKMDHLDGKLFYNLANRYHREKALKKWRNYEK